MITESISPILQWMNANPHMSGLITFIISAAESIAIIGTIVPGSVTMTAIGTLAGAGVIPLIPTLIWAILGAVVGDGISYWMGRYFNQRLPQMWPFRKHPSLLQSGEVFFNKYGGMSVVIGRFIGPIRAIVPVVAGMLGMSPIRFTLANIISAIGWAPAYMLPGILLGAASQELPPDIAMHAILTLFMIFLIVLAAFWLVYRFLHLISSQMNTILNAIWSRLGKARYGRIVTRALMHHNPRKTHGQLTIAFYFILTCCALLYLLVFVKTNGSANVFVNDTVFHFFRSLRSPTSDNMIIVLTFLGDKKVLLPVLLALFAWLAYCKRWHTATHVLALGVIAAGGIETIKTFVQSARPWGVLHCPASYSFPSGHTTLSVIFYMGFAMLMVEIFQIRNQRLVYRIAIGTILLVSMTRLYLGVHWFTDVLAGWLLGTAILMLVTISYNRKKEDNLPAKSILLTVLIAFTCTFSFALWHSYKIMQRDMQLVDWPTYTISEEAWWQQESDHSPIYRINRFGLAQQVLNIQWLSNLTEIKTILGQNGWEEAPSRDWISVLHRISDVESADHLPLVSPLYLDKKPVLVLIKHVNKKLIILRLWNPNVAIKNAQQPLWVGVVEVAPRTYSWLFKRKFNYRINLTTNLIFNKIPSDLAIRETKILHTDGKPSHMQTIILIKPKR